MIDVSKIKPGDEVLLRFVVSLAAGADYWPHVEIDLRDQLDGGISTESYLSAGLATIAGHTPKALAVGDRVSGKPRGPTGEIVATHGAEAWVKEDGGGCFTYMLTSLERVS